MQSSNQPVKIELPFANSGAKQTIPVASQISIEDARASFTDGFPPLTRIPLSAGGKPPFGTDMNGILFGVTAIQQWQSAGGAFKYDAAFASSVGGYPRGALLLKADTTGFWQSTVENNASNPDTGGAGWIAAFPSGTTGQSLGLKMSIATASASATMTADEIIVSTSLGGHTYKIPSFNKTINLALVGVGGMDVGAAPSSGYVAIYAIYNPATATSGLLAVNATASVAPKAYGGANMPAGYTASGLVSVWPTNGSGQLVIGIQIGREIGIATNTVLSTSTQQASLTSFSVAAALPRNAVSCRGDFTVGSSIASSGASCVICGTPFEVGRVANSATSSTSGATTVSSYPHIPILTAQTLYYRASTSSGTLVMVINISAYTI